jgi:uridine phosphorylase
MTSGEQSITSARAYVDYILRARGLERPAAPRDCVIAHSDAFIALVRGRYPCRTIDIGSRRSAEVHFLAPPGGRAFAATISGHGAPMTALLVEELIALGFERFYTTGPVGLPANGRTPEGPPGGVILVEDALIYEGTSRHYGAKNTLVPADPAMVERLARALSRRPVPYRRGRIATTDALYRETPGFVDEILGRGATAIDMETSAFFSVCRFHGKPAGALMFVSDVVGRQSGWDMAFVDRHLDRVEESILSTFLHCIDEP